MAHEGWVAARAEALAALLTVRKTALLLGPPGVGKTLMLAAIAQELEERGCRVHLFSKELPPPSGAFESGREQFVLIDDARRLGDSLLQDLLTAPGLRCLLAEQPSLEADVAQLRPAPLIVRLSPLSPGESRRFIAEQVAQSGRPADLLHRKAVELLIKAAGGIPRALCTIGGRALYLADLHQARQVGVSHVEKALSLLPASTSQRAAAGDAATQDDPVGDDAAPETGAPLVEAEDDVQEAAPSRRGGFPVFPVAIGAALALGALVVVLGKMSPSDVGHATETASSAAPAAVVKQPVQAAAPVSVAEAVHPVPPAEAVPAGPAVAGPSDSRAMAVPAMARDVMPSAAPKMAAEPEAVAAPASRAARETAVATALPPPAASHAAGPDMAELPGDVFLMGSTNDSSEEPVHPVAVSRFQIARHAVTVAEWQPCLDAKACTLKPEGPPDAPVTNASYTDAQQFVTWLSATTGEAFRLPTEAEWEYAARAGARTRYAWGNTIVPGKIGCKTCNGPTGGHGPALVTTYPPNAFGLYGMGGGVAEWVSDCWHHDYHGAPVNASAPWDAQGCNRRVLRGGSWMDEASEVTTSTREMYDASVRYPSHGFRIAKSF